MFAVRGIMVSLSVFVLVYCMCSLAVWCFWGKVWAYCRHYSARYSADLLFALRISPLVVSAAVTLGFAAPSFILLEPRAIIEPVGAAPVALGFCGLVLLAAGAVNAISAVAKARKAIA